MDDQPAARLAKMDAARQVWQLVVKQKTDDKWGEHLQPHEERLLIIMGEPDDDEAMRAIADIS